ncbi:NAD-dependent epimerase/dehydratase family protein [candidate division KSB1 bacterium]|nr:NAD-dependent epimerase/dehydratase family protein [candidate division KSB1 bacterium]TDI88668.1 MAG: NAD-dependent epimerase/dehydratase family protein [Caldithrix sp.]TDI97301.1 MAG: NAD-dependent epimerase/dehydratase family protein [Caldithrix sp.]
MKKKVFVTGATGFTGGHLCRILVDKGYSVGALVRKSSKTNELEKLGVKPVVGDLANLNSLNGALEDIDTVFHVAAAYRQEGISKEQFWKVNVDGTRALLEFANQSKVKRFVHCSTVGVQGEIKNPPAKESDPYQPGDHYQESKMEGEKLALKFFKERGLDGVVVRPVGIFGPGDLRFLKLFKFINNGKFRMIGKGDVLYHLTFVEDLVQGIILAGQKKEASGNIYTVGGEEFMTLKKLVALIAETLNKPVPKKSIPLKPVYIAAVMCETICRPLGIEPPLYRRRLDFFTKDRAFDISKAKKELGYKPQVPLKQGLKITAKWYKENNLI